MSFSSSPYTDLILPTPNEDNSTYGTILNTYFQALETKLKNLSDRINAAGVGSSSTLAQINRDIAQTDTNTSGILPDPYSGDFTTVSTWPAFNTELTALGLSPPQTASEIEAFFAGSDFTSFVNFLNGKLTALDTLVSTAETDICIANKYSDVVLNPEDYLVWTQTSQTTHSFTTTNSSIASGTYTNATFIPGFGTGYPPPSWNSGNPLNGVTMYTSLPDASTYGLSDVGLTRTVVSDSSITFVSNSTVVINVPDQNSGTQYATNYTFQLASAWNGAGPYYRTYTSNGPVVSGNVYDYNMTMTTYTLTLPAPDTSTC